MYALLGHHLPVSGALTTNSDKNVPVSFAKPACISVCPSLLGNCRTDFYGI